VTCASVGFVALLVAAPVLPDAPSAIIYVLASRICHQLPERSFHLAGAQLPVCARCVAIYAGFAAAAFYVWVRRPRLAGFEHGLSSRARAALTIGAMPTVLTVVAEWAGVWMPSNGARAAAGVPLGAAVALVSIAALAASGGLHYDECAPRLPIRRDRPPSHT
jgi:uncharacterized membrane protein